jgi:hypothetical protein
VSSRGGQRMSVDVAAYKRELVAARADVRALIDKLNCHPISIRLAW